MPDGSASAASAMARPRVATSRNPSVKENTPAAPSAVYSPSECPAAADGADGIASANASHNAYDNA